DVLMQSATSMLTANINGALDLVIIAAGLNRAQTAFIVRPEIKSAADLKGKIIGGDRAGTSSDYSVRIFLSKLNLDRADVVVREIGGSDVAYKALISNQIDAVPLIPPGTFQAEAQGY